MSRIAALSDVHGNATALEAVLADVAREKPDAVLVAGDLVLNGPEPALVVDVLRSLADEGALVVAGNTDIAVADFDYAAAFPWMTDGVPDAIVDAAEWAHDELGAERIDWLRRLPSERRWRTDDDTLVLVCHASPGSQTAGFDQGLEASVTIERVARTDARVIVCGHTHLPEVRDLGWKVIVNDGSAGYVFDGDPTASWALIEFEDGEVRAEIRRTELRCPVGGQRHLGPRARRRRLSRGDRPHRQARPMTGAAGRGDRDGHAHGARQRRGHHVGGPARRTSGHQDHRGVRPVAADGADRGRGAGLRREPRPGPQGPAPDRPLHPVRPRGRARGDGPGRAAGAPRRRARRADRGHPGDRARRRRDAERRVLDERPARPRPDQPVPDPDGHPERRARGRSPSTTA